ncbi:uncharacterized protein K452DRAFT_83208 [Aplosporella prunicola CBS 121167]|uniref:Secreted protein n=1 Tax=Aplosporella prunicola CBS 121167 TaxID=1176127 RepID=A0A6A6B5Y2_9PEZI|nr:uncharacterized protein K452DRAFT_83208 [Aplosporella prunicola CBS 121167]KAF2138695.1 hypothetical protein K452DRAFT_83208 [Aplosporella prunicola CBS 121167]
MTRHKTHKTGGVRRALVWPAALLLTLCSHTNTPRTPAHTRQFAAQQPCLTTEQGNTSSRTPPAPSLATPACPGSRGHRRCAAPFFSFCLLLPIFFTEEARLQMQGCEVAARAVGLARALGGEGAVGGARE